MAPQPGPPAAIPPALTASAASPVTPGKPRRWRVAAIATGVLVAGAVATLLVLQWSARAVSTDGTFSVQVPSGWVRYTGADLPDGPPTKNDLMVLLGPTANGMQAHVFIYPRQAGFIDLGQLARTWRGDQATCQFSGALSHFGPMTRTTVAGSAALATECRTPTISVEIITVDHGGHTDLIGFSAASSQFDHLRDTSLRTLIDSWRWN
jgi:hypothetical protein